MNLHYSDDYSNIKEVPKHRMKLRNNEIKEDGKEDGEKDRKIEAPER